MNIFCCLPLMRELIISGRARGRCPEDTGTRNCSSCYGRCQWLPPATRTRPSCCGLRPVVRLRPLTRNCRIRSWAFDSESRRVAIMTRRKQPRNSGVRAAGSGPVYAATNLDLLPVRLELSFTTWLARSRAAGGAGQAAMCRAGHDAASDPRARCRAGNI